MTMNNRRTLLILLLVSLLTLSSCGVEKNHDDTLTIRLNGRTGYRESICDIPCQIEEINCNKSIEGLMRDETTGEFFVVVKSIDEDSNILDSYIGFCPMVQIILQYRLIWIITD